MNLEELKRRATESAIRLMANERVRSAVDAAVGAGQGVVSELKNLREDVRRQIEAARPGEDDTAALKERLDRLRDEGAGT